MSEVATLFYVLGFVALIVALNVAAAVDNKLRYGHWLSSKSRAGKMQIHDHMTSADYDAWSGAGHIGGPPSGPTG